MSEPSLAVEPSLGDVPRTNASRAFLGHAKLIGLFTLISRFLGLGREIVAGHYLGTGLVASAFTVAFTIPNLFRKLFGEGALSSRSSPSMRRRSGEADRNVCPTKPTSLRPPALTSCVPS